MSSGLAKAGFFLVGVSVGLLGGIIFYKRELDRPIGEIEEYIPMEDKKNESDSEDISSDSESDRQSSNDISEGPRRRRGKRREGRSNSRKATWQELQASAVDFLDYYHRDGSDDNKSENGSGSDKRRSDFERSRTGGPTRDGYSEKEQQSTRYSRIYKEKMAGKALHEVNSYRNSRDSYDIVDSPSDDSVPDGPEPEIDIHDEFVLERVDDNIEIFLDDNPQDFVTLVFYEGDNTLCDDNDEIVPNAEEVVGLEALGRLISGGPGAENGVIFVHNLKTCINYEVVLDAGMYQESVMGIFASRHDEGANRGGNTG